MNKSIIYTLILMVFFSLGGIAYLTWVNWQLREELSSLENVTEPANDVADQINTVPAPQDNDPFSSTWDPFTEIQQMQQRMQKMMSQSFSYSSLAEPGNSRIFHLNTMQPQIDLTDTGEAYRVSINIPEDSNIELNTEVSDNQLLVSGKVTQKNEESSNGSLMNFTSSSSFSRSFFLDHEVDTLGMVTESLDDAMIITLPKV